MVLHNFVNFSGEEAKSTLSITMNSARSHSYFLFPLLFPFSWDSSYPNYLECQNVMGTLPKTLKYQRILYIPIKLLQTRQHSKHETKLRLYLPPECCIYNRRKYFDWQIDRQFCKVFFMARLFNYLYLLWPSGESIS